MAHDTTDEGGISVAVLLCRKDGSNQEMWGPLAAEIEALVIERIQRGATLGQVEHWFEDTYLDEGQSACVTVDEMFHEGEYLGQQVCIAVVWVDEFVEAF
ncbi:hypothetical protein [Asaia sp. VD9]|uniref:hypothetical protein n=1 Tax=Asaia sp. VD9 TaxID=3081235 RepID=UPI00301A4707